MKNRFTNSAAVSAACLALFAASNTAAATSAFRGVTVRQIEACISEIGRRADYSDAVRVMHWVSSLEALNYAELEIEVQTSVYVDDDDASRVYKTRCVSDTLGSLTAFGMVTGD